MQNPATMPFPKLTPAQLEYVVQFMHPEKYLAWSAGVDARVRSVVQLARTPLARPAHGAFAPNR